LGHLFELSLFSIQAVIAINFPLSNTIVSGRLCFNFHYIPGTFWLTPLFLWQHIGHGETCCSVSRYLSIFCCFFYYWFLFLFHCFRQVSWSYFNFLIFIIFVIPILWPIICSILEKISWAAKKNVYCPAAICNMLFMSIKSIWLIVFNSEVTLLIFLSGWLVC
jgi:hypothetical protein